PFRFPAAAPLRDIPSLPTRRSSDLAQNPAGLAMVYVLLPSGRGHDGSHKEVYMAASEGSLKRTGLDWQWRTRDFIEPSLAAMYTDRKSTRLNSSHVAISYAVFCLKK